MLNWSSRPHPLRGVLAALAVATVALLPTAAAVGATTPAHADTGLTVDVTLADGLVDGPVTGRILFLVAPQGQEPLDDVWVGGSRSIFGQNVSDLAPGETVRLQDTGDSDTGVYGFPHAALADLPDGTYTARAFLVRYTGFDRADGSSVELYQPCGDGGSPLWGPGNLFSDRVDFTVGSGNATVQLALDDERQEGATTPEIGGCHQGNYTDDGNAHHVKIRSEKLSEFWGTDVYVGANVRLPRDYDAHRAEAYPVIYSQGHWPGGDTPFWNNGGDSRFIFVSIRQESPYYDDAYSVNSANLGPWGDAIAEELVPEIDARFHTIAAPYGRLQEGGSTGGWTSLASTLFRPDVYGATWSYYPDSLDFHSHQAVNLYDGINAYVDENGDAIGSWREGDRVTVTMEQENHYELALGTNSRSFDQWDVWNAVFSPQGLNGYPLDPWDKVDGTIDHDTTALWEQQFDLTAYLRANWNSSRDLGRALEGRIHVSVGTLDNYYLNGGVEHFQKMVEELGGSDWAEVEIEPGRQHEGFYDYKSLGEELDLMWAWVNDHAPNGSDPLTAADTAASTEGNSFDEVLAWGGHEAALARQATPTINVATGAGGDATASMARTLATTAATTTGTTASEGDVVTADFGRWDPGMALVGQWTLDGAPMGDPIDLGVAAQQQVATERATRTATAADVGRSLAFAVTGSKRGYATETRSTSAVSIVAAASPTPSPTPTDSSSPSATAPTAPSSGTPSAAPAGQPSAGSQPLANTGADAVGIPIVVGATAATIGGLVLLLVAARRRARTAARDV